MDYKKVSGIGAAALLVGATIGGFVAYDPYDQADMDSAVAEAKALADAELVKAKAEAFKAGADSVPPQIVKEEVEVEVEVVVTDTELIQATCDRLLFDDMAECQLEVKAEEAALKQALDYVESMEFFEELEDEDLVEDEDEVNHIKTYSDFDEIVIKKSDYDDDKYRFEIEVKVEDEDAEKKVKVLADILVEDGDLELKSVSEI